jgi:hypothetical protein
MEQSMRRRLSTVLYDTDDGTAMVRIVSQQVASIRDAAGRRRWQAEWAANGPRETVAELTLGEAGQLARALVSDLTYVAEHPDGD